MESFLEKIALTCVRYREDCEDAVRKLGNDSFSVCPSTIYLHLADQIHGLFASFASKTSCTFKYSEFKTEHKLLPDMASISAEFHSEGDGPKKRIFSGTGEAKAPLEAKFIALMELYERIGFALSCRQGLNLCCRVGAPELLDRELILENSSGCAVHSRPDLAMRGAFLELIERDAYMAHWLTKKPPVQITLRENPLYVQIKKACSNYGLSMGTFLLKSLYDIPVVLITSFDPSMRFGASLYCQGVAAGSTIDSAFQKAAKELARFADICMTLKTRVLEIPADLCDPLGRFFHYQHPERIGNLKVFLPYRESRTVTSIEARRETMTLFQGHDVLNEADFFIYPVPRPFGLIDKVYCYLIDSDSVQKANHSMAVTPNIDRLKKLDPKFEVSLMNIEPHPLP